jgi:ATP adenylyltransferase
MDVLHAPWRSVYVTDEKTRHPDVFGEIIRSADDEANLVLVRGRTCLAVLNKYPYSTGHTMVIPYRQTGDLAELSDQEMLEMMQTTQAVIRALRAEFNPDGFNVGFNLGGAAGAGIGDHLHQHVVPRWRGDHNFMTVLAQTRVHPNELVEVARRVRARLVPGL